MKTLTIRTQDYAGNEILIHNQNGAISAFLTNGTPIGLANVNYQRPAELEFRLSACRSAAEMVEAMTHLGHSAKVVRNHRAPVRRRDVIARDAMLRAARAALQQHPSDDNTALIERITALIGED